MPLDLLSGMRLHSDVMLVRKAIRLALRFRVSLAMISLVQSALLFLGTSCDRGARRMVILVKTVYVESFCCAGVAMFSKDLGGVVRFKTLS